MMAFSGHNPHLFKWRRLSKSATSGDKVHVKNGDIDQWRKRVEMASEFAVSKVFPHKKPHSGSNNLSVPLQSSDQLRDHDDAYSEAQALLGDWLGSKLRLELEMDEEDDLMCSAERTSPVALANPQPAALSCSNFDDLYNRLAEEEEHSAVNSILQDLMEQEVLDSGVMEELALDVGQTRRKLKDPVVTMEARHLQVRENRSRREAERQRQQREKEGQRVAREEAKRRDRGEVTRKRQEAQRQEKMVQQEMVRLRRLMEERKSLERLVRQREREREEGQKAARSLQSAPPLLTKQQQQDAAALYKEQKIQTMVHMRNLKCLQRHFSGWYLVVLAQRLRLGKAMALCDWKRQLRAWRGWRAVVWAEQRQQEMTKTEQELRTENRLSQVAVESDRRRLLRRYLSEWQLWCRTEKEQRELLAKQQETKRKMAALINAASTGKIKTTEASMYQPIMAAPEAPDQSASTEKYGSRGRKTFRAEIFTTQESVRGEKKERCECRGKGGIEQMEGKLVRNTRCGIVEQSSRDGGNGTGDEVAGVHGRGVSKEAILPVKPRLPIYQDSWISEDHHRSATSASNTSAAHKIKTPVGTVTQPTQPWQVTRHHAAPTATEVREARNRVEGVGSTCPKMATSTGSRFENRHAVQQQIIAQQRKLMKEQQQQIAQLKEEQSMKELELEMEKTAQLTQLSMLGGSRPKSHKFDPAEQRAQRVTGEPDSLCKPPKKAEARQSSPHPIITAMEARARQRAERKKEIEEIKRKKEEKKLADMKAAEEQRQREEEEEKRQAAEKKKEEKRLERKREEEKQREVKRQQEFLKLASQHYHKNLLLRRGLAPWIRLIQLRQANTQLAESHHNLFLLRRCTLGWQQSASESLSEKRASADQLYQHFLLRRSLCCWKRLKDWRMIQEERAKHLYRNHTLRRFLLAMLDHVTQERLMEWDREVLAQEHNNRRVLRQCFLAWRQLPCLLRKEREKEERREKLGRKVAAVLPDFYSYPL